MIYLDEFTIEYRTFSHFAWKITCNSFAFRYGISHNAYMIRKRKNSSINRVYTSQIEEFHHSLKSAIFLFVPLVSVAILICASPIFATYAQIDFDWFILSSLTFA